MRFRLVTRPLPAQYQKEQVSLLLPSSVSHPPSSLLAPPSAALLYLFLLLPLPLLLLPLPLELYQLSAMSHLSQRIMRQEWRNYVRIAHPACRSAYHSQYQSPHISSHRESSRGSHSNTPLWFCFSLHAYALHPLLIIIALHPPIASPLASLHQVKHHGMDMRPV